MGYKALTQILSSKGEVLAGSVLPDLPKKEIDFLQKLGILVPFNELPKKADETAPVPPPSQAELLEKDQNTETGNAENAENGESSETGDGANNGANNGKPAGDQRQGG